MFSYSAFPLDVAAIPVQIYLTYLPSYLMNQECGAKISALFSRGSKVFVMGKIRRQIVPALCYQAVLFHLVKKCN